MCLPRAVYTGTRSKEPGKLSARRRLSLVAGGSVRAGGWEPPPKEIRFALHSAVSRSFVSAPDPLLIVGRQECCKLLICRLLLPLFYRRAAHNPSEPYASVDRGFWHSDTTIPLSPGSRV